MTWMGKVKIADLAPNHPFAHTQIGVGQKTTQPSEAPAADPSPSLPLDMDDPQAMLELQDKIDQAIREMDDPKD